MGVRGRVGPRARECQGDDSVGDSSRGGGIQIGYVSDAPRWAAVRKKQREGSENGATRSSDYDSESRGEGEGRRGFDSQGRGEGEGRREGSE
eukprot:401487-Pleurochrysis_carterae.AAC.1